MINILKAEKTDILKICELENLCFSPAWSEAQLTFELDSSDALFVVARDDNELCGFAIFHRSGDEAELYQIAVDKSYRRHGVARLLMKHGLAWAKDNSLSQIFLEVRSQNSPARSLYESVGFKTLGIRKNYYDMPADDAVIMSAEV